MLLLVSLCNHTLSCDLQHVLAKLYRSSSSKDELERSSALPATCETDNTTGIHVVAVCRTNQQTLHP